MTKTFETISERTDKLDSKTETAPTKSDPFTVKIGTLASDIGTTHSTLKLLILRPDHVSSVKETKAAEKATQHRSSRSHGDQAIPEDLLIKKNPKRCLIGAAHSK